VFGHYGHQTEKSLLFAEPNGYSGCMVTVQRIVILGLALFAAAASASAEQQSSSSRPVSISPCAAVIAAARANDIPLDKIDPPGEAGVLSPGDSVTVLVTLRQKGDRRTQWLLYLETLTPGGKEPSPKAPSSMVLYSCSGQKFEYASAPVPVRLQTLGPFTASGPKKSKPQSYDMRFALDKGFLGIGLEQAATAVSRLKEAKAKGSLWFRNTPLSDAEIERNRKSLGNIRLSAEEERALGGSCPALMSYLNIVQHTEHLKAILFQLVDLPSVWSMVRHGGVNANLSILQDDLARADGTSWGLPDSRSLYDMPVVIELNKQPALKVTLTVTTPLPPLLACGGIVGFVAERPGDKEMYLTVRVISARHSTATAPLARTN
jgi:hypothetical protein